MIQRLVVGCVRSGSGGGAHRVGSPAVWRRTPGGRGHTFALRSGNDFLVDVVRSVLGG
jgi:hypothetical protein